MVATQQRQASTDKMPMRAGESVAPDVYEQMRRRLILEHCKWDPQVGDVETIARFPLILDEGEWHKLSDFAEQLAAELMEAEKELLALPELHKHLGLPRGLRSVLKRATEFGATSSPVRTLRFDFHWTESGWKISEVNSDVPGGYCEASELPAMMAEHYPQTKSAGHPGAVWANLLAESIGNARAVALLSAAGFMEDRQVLSYLAQLLRTRGVDSHWANPNQIRWNNGLASLNPGHMPLETCPRQLRSHGPDGLGFSSIISWRRLGCGAIHWAVSAGVCLCRRAADQQQHHALTLPGGQ